MLYSKCFIYNLVLYSAGRRCVGFLSAQHSHQDRRAKMVLYSLWSSSSDPANLKSHAAITSLTWLPWKGKFSTIGHYGLFVSSLHRCSEFCDCSDLYKHICAASLWHLSCSLPLETDGDEIR